MATEKNEVEKESRIRDSFLRNKIIDENGQAIILKPDLVQQDPQVSDEENELSTAEEPVELLEQQNQNVNDFVPVILINENQPLLIPTEEGIESIDQNLINSNDSPVNEQFNRSLLDAIKKQSGIKS